MSLRNWCRIFIIGILAVVNHLLDVAKADAHHRELEKIKDSFKCFPATSHIGIIGQIHCPQYITVGERTGFGDWIFLTAWDSFSYMKDGKETIQEMKPVLTIGNDCWFGAFSHITCINKIQIGNWLLTGKFVTITDNSHGTTDFDSFKFLP